MSTDLTLYKIEDHLLALLDTEEMEMTPEQRAEFERELVAAELRAVDKRDHVAQFLGFLKGQQSNIATEVKRLNELKRRYEATQERVEGYVKDAVMLSGPQPDGTYRKLEGRTSVIGVQRNGGHEPSPRVIDSGAIPLNFGKCTGSITYDTWCAIRGLCEWQGGVATQAIWALNSMRWEPDMDLIAAALRTGEEVPGVERQERGYHVVIR